MTKTLSQVQAYLADESNSDELNHVLLQAKNFQIEAGNVDGIAREYMQESLLYWLEYHADQFDSVEDIDLDELEAVNSADIGQRAGLLHWAWNQSFVIDPESLDPADPLEDVINLAAEALEIAAVRALVEVYDVLSFHDEEAA